MIVLHEEIKNSGIVAIGTLVIAQVVMYRESPLIVGRFALSMLYLWVFPLLPLTWLTPLPFSKRILLSTMLSIAVIPILSYLTNLVGVSFGVVQLLIPAIVFAGSVAVYYYCSKKK